MSALNHQDASLVARDTLSGDEDNRNRTGTAVAFSQDEIDDLLYNDSLGRGERLARLRQLRDEMANAESADLGADDPGSLLEEIEGAILRLDGHERASGEAVAGADPREHRETLSPDDDFFDRTEGATDEDRNI